MASNKEQRVWVMECADHPLLNRINGIEHNIKNGIHVHFPDLVCDRRKLIEIRRDALKMCKYFAGTCNDAEDIFDEAVYKVAFLFLRSKLLI